MASLKSGTTIGTYTAIHTNNIGSYALTSVPSNVITTSGGQTIAGITYFSNGESLNLYGIRGRFTNEYIHLYHKVGIGHPGGWGQGEGSTPGYGLSTYGGINIAYGSDNGATINTYTRINKNWAGGDYGAEQLTIRGTYPSIALRSTQHDSKWLIHHADSLQFYFGGTVDNNSWSNKIQFATDGNIWSAYYGDWLSNIFNSKQNASTAITTSNIGSQSVSYASSAGSVAWGNVSSKPSYIMYYQGFTLDANTMDTNSTGFTYAVNAPFYGPIARFSTGGGYDLWIGGAYSGGGNGFYLRTRNGDNGTFNAWREIITSGNIASQSVSYADESGYSASSGSVEWTSVQNKPSLMPLSGIPSGSDQYVNLRVIRNSNAGSGSGMHIGYGNQNSGDTLLYGGGGTSAQLYVYGDHVYSPSSFRAPIFYDSADTSYYVDPNSYSRIYRTSTHLAPSPGVGSSNWVNDFNATPTSSMSFGGDLSSGGPQGTWWFQQNFRHSNSSNYWGTQVAWGWEDNANELWQRNVTGGNWSGWVRYLNSNNYGAYAVPKSGAELTEGNYFYFRSNRGSYLGGLDSPSLQVYATGSNAAFMSFHRGGSYAVNFGLDADNVMRIGGWSAGADRWVLDMSGNNTVAGSFRAPIFYDSNDTNYYVDPNGASRINGLYIVSSGNNVSGDDASLYISGTNNDWGIIVGKTSYDYGILVSVSGSATYAYSSPNFRVSGAGAVYSTIFYDTNDTNYYVDPNGMSKQVQLTNLGTYGSNASNARNHFVQYNAGNAAPATGWIAAAFGDDTTNRVVIGQWNSNTGAIIGSHSRNLDDWAGLSYVATEHIFYAPSWTSSEKLKVNSDGVYAPAYRGNANVGGTGNATWHPDGIYCGSTMWQYGDMHKNGTWIYQLGGFSHTTNAAEFRPNNGSYGSFIVGGSRNGWRGIEFESGSNGNVTVMIANSSSTSGFHNNSYGWQIQWDAGTLYVGKGTYGGSVATVLDSSNAAYAWNMNQYVRTSDSPTFQSLFLPQNPVGSTYGNGVSATPPNRIEQRVGDNDGWRIYGEAGATNEVRMVFELIDDIETAYSDQWVFRNKLTYGAYTARNEFQISGNGDAQARGSMRAPIFYSSVDTNYFWEPNVSSAHRFRTANGYVDIGPMNSSWCHFQTDRANFYFGSTIYADASGFATYGGSTSMTKTDINSPIFLVPNHSDNTKGYRIYNTSNSSVSAMFVNSSNQLVIAAGAVDQINLNKKVYVNGVALGVNVAPSATAGRIDASNDIVAYSTSDERFKENITPISNALDKVKTLTGVEFDWRKETKDYHGYVGHDVGVIAQQVKAVLPEAVRTNANGYLAVRYEKLIGLLIEGMKEQQAQIDELKAKLDGLTK